MFDSIWVYPFLLALPFLVAVTLGIHFFSGAALWWFTAKPVVCVCRVENRVGVVLRKDYEKCSRRFWKAVGKIERKPGSKYIVSQRGMAIPVIPVYVFTADSQELRSLLCSCWPEESAFNVPGIFQSDADALKHASKHILRRSWDRQLLST